MPFLIRRAVSNDAEPIAALAQSVQALHAEALPHIFKPTGPDVFPSDVVRASLERLDHFMYVAVDEEAIIGYVQAEAQHEAETDLKHGAELVYVRQMGVAPAYQRRGVGRQLLDAVRGEAASRGITAISLTVYAANDVARDFYLKYGFAPYREDLRLP